MIIQDYSSLEELSRASAELFQQIAAESVSSKGIFSVALSGGSTPEMTYQILSKPPFRDTVPWKKTHVFWGDERYVPSDDDLSNSRMARRVLLNHVPVPDSNIHPIPYLPTPQQSAIQYESILRNFFQHQAPRFDLILLGMGSDGHTASLFPGTTILNERERWAKEVFLPSQNMYRITITLPLINRAANIAFLVHGSEKAAILASVLGKRGNSNALPAQLVHPENGELYWLVDKAALGTRPQI